MGVMLRMRSAFSENEPDLEKLIQDPNDDNHSHAASRVDITKVWNWLKNIPRKWKVFLGVFLMLCIILHNRYLGALSAYQQKIVLSSNPHRNLCTLEVGSHPKCLLYLTHVSVLELFGFFSMRRPVESLCLPS